MTVYYVSQLDYTYTPYPTRTDPDHPEHANGHSSTVRTSGCGLCAAVMVAHRLRGDTTFSVMDALALAMKTGANHGRGTDYRIFAPAFSEREGLAWEATGDGEKLDRCLAEGGCAVAHIRIRPDGSLPILSRGTGHYVTVIGRESDGRYAVLDPSFSVEKYQDPYRAAKAELRGTVVFVEPDALYADVATMGDRGFYLFRLKDR